uniref:VPS35 endosomal protein-sorting factor-like n=1 Tax=Monopterus albus TaxID=43700 RepID=A0A3Q3J5U4_MONAL
MYATWELCVQIFSSECAIIHVQTVCKLSQVHREFNVSIILVGNHRFVCCVTRRSRGRNYEAELQKCSPEVSPVEFGDYHPLKPIMVTDTKNRRGARKGSTSSSSSSSSSAAPDPLSSMLDGTDPLSMFAAASASETPAMSHSDLRRKKEKEKEEEVVGPDFEPWSAKRGEILARFTTTEKLSIVSCSPFSHQQLSCSATMN